MTRFGQWGLAKTAALLVLAKTTFAVAEELPPIRPPDPRCERGYIFLRGSCIAERRFVGPRDERCDPPCASGNVCGDKARCTSPHVAPLAAAFAKAKQTDELHRFSLEFGAFTLPKGNEDLGPAFGASYAYRVIHGVELGGGLRYFLVPGLGYKNQGNHMLLAAGSVRGYFTLDRADRVELGFTARVGLLVHGNMRGVCCAGFALAPDLRVWLADGVGLQLSPELAIGQTGNHNGPNTYDYQDELFGWLAAWLGYVHAL